MRGALGLRGIGHFDRRSMLLVIYAIYVTFVLILSSGSFLAQKEVRGILTEGEYETHLVFPEDGTYEHYRSVQLFDKNSSGRIDLKYIFESNTLLIEKVENIKEIIIDYQMMYENTCYELLGEDPSILGPEHYKTYFRETNNGLFKVIINTDTPLEKLHFLNIPVPTSVLVNNKQWWETETEYYTSYGNDVEINYIPVGLTSVEIFFQEVTGQNPTALFTASKYVATPQEIISFDASGSFDTDGEILHYIWDLGDTTQGSDKIIDHSYAQIGNYTVTLTVRDNDYLEGITSRTIHIVQEGVDADEDGVPNELDLNPYHMTDSDGDGLSDDFEDIIAHTNKTNRDADGDGFNDDVEWEEGTDPNDLNDHPFVEKEKKTGESSSMWIMVIIIPLLFIVFLLLRARRIRRIRKGKKAAMKKAGGKKGAKKKGAKKKGAKKKGSKKKGSKKKGTKKKSGKKKAADKRSAYSPFPLQTGGPMQTPVQGTYAQQNKNFQIGSSPYTRAQIEMQQMGTGPLQQQAGINPQQPTGMDPSQQQMGMGPPHLQKDTSPQQQQIGTSPQQWMDIGPHHLQIDTSPQQQQVGTSPQQRMDMGPPYLQIDTSPQQQQVGTGPQQQMPSTVAQPTLNSSQQMPSVVAQSTLIDARGVVDVAQLSGSKPLVFPKALPLGIPISDVIKPAIEGATTIENIFILSKDNVPINHYTSKMASDIDPDILSSMLMVVQAFVGDSLKVGDDSLNELKFKEFTIMISKGTLITIAAIVTGPRANEFRSQIDKAIKDIENEHGEALKIWDDDVDGPMNMEKNIKKLVMGGYS